MQVSKKFISLLVVLMLTATMVACGEEDKSSSDSEITTTTHTVESKTDTKTTTTATESTEPVESELESSEWEQLGTLDYSFEAPINLKMRGGSCGTTYQDLESDFYLIMVDSIHKYGSVDYSLDNSSEWLEKSKKSIIEEFDLGTFYCAKKTENQDTNVASMIIENNEIVNINNIKFVKFSGYFDAEDETNSYESCKCLFTGYLTVYQSDNSDEYGYIEPDVCSIIATMPEDKADMEKMQEVADHAAETLEFLK